MNEEFGIEFHDNGTGLLKIAMASDLGLSGSGTVATIALTIAPSARSGQYPMALLDAKLHDEAGRDFATSVIRMNIEREDGQLQVNSNEVYLPLVLHR
jgi:hypothetical protein